MHVELRSQSDTECIICLDDVETEWITLECRHQYHKKCIQAWTRIRMNCPICIHQITSEYASRIGIEEHIINVDAIPQLEDEQAGEQTQRNVSVFLCGMLLVSIISMLFGVYELIQSKN